MLPGGLRPFRVTNPQAVDVLLMHNKKYAVEIARTVGGKKRVAILERCADRYLPTPRSNCLADI